MLIADEIQTGFGRTGKMFAMEHFGVVPDLMTIAKSLAAGLPLSAVTGRAEIMDAPAPGGLGGTYAGNPLGDRGGACGDRRDGRGAPARTRRRARPSSSRPCSTGCARRCRRSPTCAVSARWWRSSSPTPTAAPDADFTKRVQAEALKRKLILLTCGVDANVVRFLFPLATPQAVFDEALGILRESLLAARP